ncbi:DUF2127 domain-containing protein [Microbacterium soli]|uniref:DUF2127 domain-containing protein n=1 Tax=Microbacterium soli TaxID=446075 RepID=A0ABP7N5R4_9MICO
MRQRMLDLLFLVGVVGKGIDGLAELVGGVALLVASPAGLQHLAQVVTAHELAEDPHDILANLLLHGVSGLDPATAGFLAGYLLLHGLVKIAIVLALLRGSRRIYPWAIAALTIFLLFQLYELFVTPSVLLIVLTMLDALIVALTWREWRHDRTLRDTARSTIDWVLRRRAVR